MLWDNYREHLNIGKTTRFLTTRRAQSSRHLTDEREIEDRFYRDLEFGTGGLRGVMGAGTNRMNQYTVRRATTGFAQFLLDTYGDAAKTRGVAIAYDSRNRSAEFAREAALTMAACRHPGVSFHHPLRHAAFVLCGAASGLRGRHRRHGKPQSEGI